MKRFVILALAALIAVLAYAATSGPQAGAKTASAADTATPASVATPTATPALIPARTTAAPTTAAPKTSAPKAVAPKTVAPKTVAPKTSASAAPTSAARKPSATSAKAKAAPVATRQKATANTVTISRAQSHVAYIKAMYRAVVPARQRAALAGRYTLGYNLPGLSCGTGCTNIYGSTVRTSFDSAFFSQPTRYQRNILAHEAAHAYGYLHFARYDTPSWAHVGGWQARFHTIDRSFVGHYDAEAFATCVAWKESGFHNHVLQTSGPCTARAATLAMAQIK
jgi:hypothetical protein